MSHVPYASAVGFLMYSIVYTRPNISHAVGVLSRYMTTLGKEHWASIKRVFRYLCGMTNFTICHPRNSKDVRVHGFVDSNWAGEIDGRRPTNGYVFRLFGGAISCMSRKQSMVALSSTEAENIIATHASKEAVWLQ